MGDLVAQEGVEGGRGGCGDAECGVSEVVGEMGEGLHVGFALPCDILVGCSAVEEPAGGDPVDPGP